MANYGVVRLDNMSGTTDGTLLRSVRFYDNDKEAAIENGRVVLIGDLLDGQREVRKATAPTATSPLTHIGLVAAPELMYDERKRNLTEFINEAGENVRVYIPHSLTQYIFGALGIIGLNLAMQHIGCELHNRIFLVHIIFLLIRYFRYS